MKYPRIPDLVSVVISNYNNENYIAECLDSILNQTYQTIEIILVDDNSTDNSIAVIKEWIDKNRYKFPNEDYIKLLQLPSNVGFSGCVTAGLFLAKGEYIAMQDGDDKSSQNRIEKQVKYLKDNDKIGSIGSNYLVFADENNTLKAIQTEIAYGIDKIKDRYSSGENCVSNSTLLIKGTVFDSIGGFTRKVDGSEDYEFVSKLLPFGVDNINEELYYYRQHEKRRSIEFNGANKSFMNEKDLKILMVLDSLNIGGTETHVLTLIKEFMSRGIRVCLLSDHGPLSSEFMKLGCTMYNLDFPLRVIKDVTVDTRYKNQIKQIIKAENINIIHAHQSPSGALCIDIGKELNIPCIFTIHGLYYYDILFDRLSLCDNIISVSQPVYDWLLEYNITSTVIPNAIDFEHFATAEKKTSIREELGIEEDAFMVVYCSRIAWDKTKVAENLLRVFRDLIRIEKLDMHLVIVGDGPDLNQIVGIANRINSLLGKTHIHLVGGKTNVLDYYIESDCIVGTGRVAIEAMGLKKPVVAAGNNGYFGLLDCTNIDYAWRVYFGDHKSLKSNNASFLYSDLKDVYNNRNHANECGESCYEWAKGNFDIKNNIDSIINVYINAIKNTI